MKNLIRWSIISLLSLTVLSFVTFVLFKLGIIQKITSKITSSQIKVFGIIFLGILLVASIIFVIFRIASKKAEENNNRVPDAPKIRVDSTIAIESWKEQFIIDTNIQYKIEYYYDEYEKKEKKRIAPINGTSIIIRNETSHFDETGQTSDKSIDFEAIVTEGNRPGLKTVRIPLDYGEEHIKKNWNNWIRDNKSMNMIHALNFDKFPMTSAKDLNERIYLKRLEYLKEGYTEDEVRPYIDPFIQQNNVRPQPVPSLEQPALTGQVQVMTPDDDLDLDSSENIEKDKEAYRRKNQ